MKDAQALGNIFDDDFAKSVCINKGLFSPLLFQEKPLILEPDFGCRRQVPPDGQDGHQFIAVAIAAVVCKPLLSETEKTSNACVSGKISDAVDLFGALLFQDLVAQRAGEHERKCRSIDAAPKQGLLERLFFRRRPWCPGHLSMRVSCAPSATGCENWIPPFSVTKVATLMANSP